MLAVMNTLIQSLFWLRNVVSWRFHGFRFCSHWMDLKAFECYNIWFCDALKSYRCSSIFHLLVFLSFVVCRFEWQLACDWAKATKCLAVHDPKSDIKRFFKEEEITSKIAFSEQERAYRVFFRFLGFWSKSLRLPVALLSLCPVRGLSRCDPKTIPTLEEINSPVSGRFRGFSSLVLLLAMGWHLLVSGFIKG